MPESRLDLKKKRIRSFFLSLGDDDEDRSTEEIETEIIEVGLEYKQMKLPVEKITPEFEKELREKAEKNILHANIREAKEEDLQSVVHLYNRSWMTSNTPFAPIDLDSIKQIHSYPETTILIASVYGNDAGFVILDFEGANNEYGIIAGLGVIPRYQRKGLGTVIGMAAWDYLKKKNVKELRCEVYIENKTSYEFISSLGFEVYNTKVYKSGDFALDERL